MINKLTKKQIRYACFRLQTEASGGAKADLQYINEIKSNFESQKCFLGWNNFSKYWDVSKTEPLKAVFISKSNEDKWNDILRENSKELN